MMVTMNTRAFAPNTTRVRFGEGVNPDEMSSGGAATLELPFREPLDRMLFRRGTDMASLKPKMPRTLSDFRRLLMGLVAGDSRPVKAVVDPEATQYGPGNVEWMKDRLWDAFMRLLLFSKVEKERTGKNSQQTRDRLPLMDMMTLKRNLGLQADDSDALAWKTASERRQGLRGADRDEWIEIGDGAQRHLDPAGAHAVTSSTD